MRRSETGPAAMLEPWRQPTRARRIMAVRLRFSIWILRDVGESHDLHERCSKPATALACLGLGSAGADLATNTWFIECRGREARCACQESPRWCCCTYRSPPWLSTRRSTTSDGPTRATFPPTP